MKTPVAVSLMLISIVATCGSAAPELTIRRTNPGELTLEWGGTAILERSGDLTGSWEPVPGASSGWTTSPIPSTSFFRLKSALLLQVAVTGQGTGTVSSTPEGLTCTNDCQALFAEGATVTLNAVADPGSEFTGWTGDFVGMGTCQLPMDEPKSVTATFELTPSPGEFINWDFEQGSGVGWIQSPSLPPMILPTYAQYGIPPYSGQYAARLGYALDDRKLGQIGQVVTLPDAGPIYLNFALWIRSSELCDVPYYDTFGVYLKYGFSVFTVFEETRLCQRDFESTGWFPVSIDLSAGAGNEYLVSFAISSIDTLMSEAFIDNVHFSNTPW